MKHIPIILLLRHPKLRLIKKIVGTKGKGYRTETVTGTKLPSVQKEKGAAPLYKVKTAVAAFCRRGVLPSVKRRQGKM